MLTDKDKNKISLYCYAAVSGLFADFINAENRGPNFTWEKFPKMAADHCFASIFTSSVPVHKLNEYKDNAFNLGQCIAKQLVSRAGLS